MFKLYRKEEDVSDGECCDHIWYEPTPQIAYPDLLEVQNGDLSHRTRQHMTKKKKLNDTVKTIYGP
jgi:hypothetical protein